MGKNKIGLAVGRERGVSLRGRDFLPNKSHEGKEDDGRGESLGGSLQLLLSKNKKTKLRGV